jgi:riboflavin kinase/FMN adenylyltransferase
VRLIRDWSELPTDRLPGALTIGNFDGVHRGHARILQRLVQRARLLSGPAIVFTFDPHPVRILRPNLAPPPLTWTDRKAELLAEQGVDWVISYPTDEALLSLTPEAFFQQIVVERLGARVMIEGPNFFFGRGRSGDISALRQLCDRASVELEIVAPLVVGDQFVSSSRVRNLIERGDLDAACALLTHPYRIRGMVTHGAGRGARIGFPTANLSAVDTLLPGVGVYAGRALVEGNAWCAAINVGPNPTFQEQALKVEVHLIDYHGSLYGATMEVDFLTRLRDIHPFKSVDELKLQLAEDVTRAAEFVTDWDARQLVHSTIRNP